nr:reverse transcriptase domain-containing protein [Tanacetum cinerariifolium]
MNTASSSGLGTLLSNTITNPMEDLKGITTRSGNAYQGPTIPTTYSPSKVVECTEVTKDTVPPINDRSTKDIAEKLGDPVKFLIPCDFSGMDECLALADLGASINLMPLSVWKMLSLPELSPTFIDFDADPRVPLVLERSFLKIGRALIGVYEGELTLHVGKEAVTFNLDQNLRYSSNYDDMSVNRIDVIDVACEDDFLLEETDAFLAIDDEPISLEIDDSYYESEGEILLLKEFLNDDPSSPPLPLQELKIVEPKNEKSSIDEPLVVELKDSPPHLEYAFLEGMDECLALANLGASINLMPLSVWKMLSLPELSPTFIDFDADPRVPLVLERSFLKIGRALIGVYEGELTLHVGKEAVTFNLDQNLRYSSNYDDMLVNRIDVIDVACEEYSQEILRFYVSGNPTLSVKPIVSTFSPTLTPFRDSDFLLEETDAFLAIDDEPISSEIDDSYYESEGEILLLKEFLNNDPSSPPLPLQELKIVEPKNEKSSIDEPLVVELKDSPPHLEYAFLEGDDKLPIITAKDLNDEEKTALIKVLKSQKQALAWQLSDIKGINPKFCIHKILMEDDFKPAVQHQKRVSQKIHKVIKKEVLKLLNARLIYLISDSPWVSPVQCVPKKGSFTVVENEEIELIPTRLVTGWRVCIDYRKLNDATRKDHFPLPFMDQMLERLAGNDYYCFLDGFSGYFQIPIDPQGQEKTTFTCPYGTFAYRRMPFGLCNTPGTFQRCMMAIFHDMIKKTTEVFMDDFSVFENSFGTCLSYLDKMLKRCEDTNLCLN